MNHVIHAPAEWPSKTIEEIAYQLNRVIASIVGVGIDPGITGALAVVGFSEAFVPLAGGVLDLPTLPDPGDKVKGRQKIDVPTLFTWLRRIRGSRPPERIVLLCEKFLAMPAAKGASMHSDDPAKAVGRLRGMEASNTRLAGTTAAIQATIECAATCEGMRSLTPRTPQQWRKAMGLSTSLEKDNARAIASRLYPGLAHRLRAKAAHNRAEALLLAGAAARAST